MRHPGDVAAEEVLGLPRASLPDGCAWRGVRADLAEAEVVALAARAVFRVRDEVEDDPSWKQLIPYLLLRDGPRVFLMRRTSAGRDARLHERLSIGVGGHVNPGDRDLLGGLRREWTEEIEAHFEPRFRFIGLLNDDEDPVGRVHLGIVYAADAAGRPVAIRERHKLSGRFAPLDEVAAVRDRLEGWSALLFDHLRGSDDRR